MRQTTDRQTDKADRQAGRQADRQTGRQAGRQARSEDSYSGTRHILKLAPESCGTFSIMNLESEAGRAEASGKEEEKDEEEDWSAGNREPSAS